MSTISASSIQAYRAWIDPARIAGRKSEQSQPNAPVERRERPVIVNLSPEAEKMVADTVASTVKTAGGTFVKDAAESYEATTSTGAGRREAPFAHQDQAARYQPPGRLIDRTI